MQYPMLALYYRDRIENYSQFQYETFISDSGDTEYHIPLNYLDDSDYEPLYNLIKDYPPLASITSALQLRDLFALCNIEYLIIYW